MIIFQKYKLNEGEIECYFIHMKFNSCAILNAHTNGKSHMKNVPRMHHRRNEKFQSLDFYDTSYKLTINEITCLDRDIHIPCPICIKKHVCGKNC